MRSRGATLSHTERSEASRKAGQDFISEQAPGLSYMWKSEGCDRNFKSFYRAKTGTSITYSQHM